MTSKLPMLVAYALVGLLLALWPLVMRPSPTLPRNASITVGILKVGKWRLAAGVWFGLLITSVLPWWRHTDSFALTLSWSEAVMFMVLTTACLAGLLWRTVPAPNEARHQYVTTTAFAVLALFFSFSTVSFEHVGVLQMAWHHWGAYIGPTELMLAGARVMRDFPTQYGLGPTALIAYVCGKSCWSGTFYLTGTVTFAFALLTALIAARVVKPASGAQWTTILLLCLVCCFFWDANPVLVGSPMVTPSVNGMRFLPALALTAFLLLFDRTGRTPVQFPYAASHMAWALCALWSVESAFYATCIWWPYYLLLRQEMSADRRLVTLSKSIAILAALLTAWVVCFLGGYWLVYQTMPTGTGIFAYIVNPPGLMAVNYRGTVWFFVAVICLGTSTNLQNFKHSGNSSEFRHGMVLTLLAYSTFSYFLGRSHDNNVLNLLPFLMLVLLNVWSRTSDLLHGLVTGLLAGLLGWLSVFGWNAWTDVIHTRELSWFDANWADRVMPGAGGGPKSFSVATQGVIAQTQAIFPDPVTVAGPTANPSTVDAAAVWSAFHSPANLHMFTPDVRRDFLRRTAQTLQRSGWLLVWKDEPIAVGMVPDFDAVYTRTHSFEMAGYLAIHYIPTAPAASNKTGQK